MRSHGRWAVAATVATMGMVGCAGAVREPPATTPVKIIEKNVAETTAIRVEDYETAFGNGQNGTELVMAYLQDAMARRATYVSDLYVALLFKWRGFPVECRSRIHLATEMKKREAAAVAPTPALPATNMTHVEDFQPRALAYRATDQDLECKRQGFAVSVPGHGYSDRSLTDEFDVSNKFMEKEPSQNGMVTKIVFRDVCEKKTVTHDTVRFDYQAALGFVPVNWPIIQRTYADERIVEDGPQCYRLEEGEITKPHHVLHGRLYYRANTAGVKLTPRSDIVEHYRVEGWTHRPQP